MLIVFLLPLRRWKDILYIVDILTKFRLIPLWIEVSNSVFVLLAAMVMNNNTRRLAPTIRPLVEALFTSGLFSEEDLEIVAPLSGFTLHDIDNACEELCDRFKLILPFAGYPVIWEVIFDGSCSNVAPDFIFDDESFLCECDLESIPSLVNWNPSDVTSFVSVISDLLRLYSKHQWKEAERNISPSVKKWLDVETIENDGLIVEILHGGPVRILHSVVPRQNTLQHGATSVLVKVPVICNLVDSKRMQFSVHYIFKSHVLSYEEKINCSPELEEWLRPYAESFKKRNKWTCDTKALSAAVQSHNKDITDLLKKSVTEHNERQNLQLSLFYDIMAKSEVCPSLLEFDFNDFQFSSYLLLGKKLFTVDIIRGAPRGRLFEISGDCYGKSLQEVKAPQLCDPSFDILQLLSKFEAK